MSGKGAGKRTTPPTLEAPHAKCYHGQFKGDLRHGEGKLAYMAEGSYYLGEWVAGERKGKGERHYGDGAMYYGDWKNDMRDGSGKYYHEKEQLLCEGAWVTDQLHGKATVTFGGTSRLRNLWFGGDFVANECASGTLRLGPGEKDSIQGSLRLVLGKSGSVRFYTDAELAAGLHKFWVLYLKMAGDQVLVEKFERRGEAASFYGGADMTIGEEVRAKLLVGDQEVLRKAGAEEHLAKVDAKAKQDGILERPAVAYPKFASKFAPSAQFAQIVKEKEARVGRFKQTVELADGDSD